MATVCAMVLTYNRTELLARCLSALEQQTVPCDRILVVNNASTDNTEQMLAEHWPNVEVHSLDKNVGAAGGFNLGMRLAYLSGADFVWVMDDDVIVDADALEQLLGASECLSARGVEPPYLVSAARSTSGLLTEVPDIDRRKNALGFPDWGRWLEDGIVPVLGATFASILVPRKTFTEHGLPIASMFIFGEDREFTVRVTRGEPGFMVGASKVLHARKIEGVLSTRAERDPVRIGYHFYLHRNTTYTVMKFDTRARIALHLLRQAKSFLSFVIHGQWRRASLIARGTGAGFFYRPEIEAADAPFDRTAVRAHPAPPRSASVTDLRTFAAGR